MGSSFSTFFFLFLVGLIEGCAPFEAFLGSGVQINFREGEVENYLVGRVLGEGASAVVKEGFGKMRITGWFSR